MSKFPLTDAELRAIAPSIFADSPIEGVSDRYAFVPTSSIIEAFRKANYYPILAGESKANSDNLGFQKHILQFRSMDKLLRPNSDEEIIDLVVTNSHNRSSSLVIDACVVRSICQNTLYYPSKLFSHHSIIHSGFNLEKVTAAINELISYMPHIESEIAKFKQISLSDLEQHSLAKAAIDIRFEKDSHIIDSKELLYVQREEDDDSSLWIIFNRIQESIIRGGVKGYNRHTGRAFTSKPITAIDTTLKLNKELFSTVQTMADLKSSSYLMAA